MGLFKSLRLLECLREENYQVTALTSWKLNINYIEFADTSFSEGTEPAWLEVQGSEVTRCLGACELLLLGVGVIRGPLSRLAGTEQFVGDRAG